MSTTTKKKTTKTKTASLDLPNNPFAFEVLDLVSKQRSKAKKIEVLKKFEHISLKALFIWNFDESVKSMLPEGDVPYTGFEDQASHNGTLSTKIDESVRRMHETDSFSMGSSDRNGHTSIRREYKNFYHFIKGGNDGLSAVRRETMFINVLEGLHPLEAQILCLCKDKKLSDKYKITKEIVAEAYSDIQWGGRS
jgi:hypothetical protein